MSCHKTKSDTFDTIKMVLFHESQPTKMRRRKEKSSALAVGKRSKASTVLPESIDENSPVRNDQIIHVAKTLCPQLCSDDESETQNVISSNKQSLTVKPLQGGLSNELFVVSNGTSHVLVRVHPSSETSIIDRNMENRLAAWLSLHGDAPIFYGRFKNGRVEQFYQDYVPLNCREMKLYDAAIARLMARMHQSHPPGRIFDKTTQGHVWERLEEWMELARGTTYQELWDTLRKDLDWLYRQLTGHRQTTDKMEQKAIEFCRQIVLTHMDCQSLNLLRPKDSQDPNDLCWIDFEYAGLNPRAADIANTFCEHCDMNNIKADYENEYPSEETQTTFLMAYLEALAASPLDDLNQKDQEAFLLFLRNEIGRFTLLSHVGWAVWSLVQEQISNIEFDYIAYGRHRLQGYDYFKAKFFSA